MLGRARTPDPAPAPRAALPGANPGIMRRAQTPPANMDVFRRLYENNHRHRVAVPVPAQPQNQPATPPLARVIRSPPPIPPPPARRRAPPPVPGVRERPPPPPPPRRAAVSPIRAGHVNQPLPQDRTPPPAVLQARPPDHGDDFNANMLAFRQRIDEAQQRLREAPPPAVFLPAMPPYIGHIHPPMPFFNFMNQPYLNQPPGLFPPPQRPNALAQPQPGHLPRVPPPQPYRVRLVLPDEFPIPARAANNNNNNNMIMMAAVNNDNRRNFPERDDVPVLHPRLQHDITARQLEDIKSQVLEMFGDVLPTWIEARVGHPVDVIINFIIEHPKHVPRVPKTKKRISLNLLEDFASPVPAKIRGRRNRNVAGDAAAEAVMEQEDIEAEQQEWVNIVTPCVPYNKLFESNQQTHPNARQAAIADITKALSLKKYDCFGKRTHAPMHAKAAEETEAFTHLLKRCFSDVPVHQINKLNFRMSRFDTLLIMELIQLSADKLYDLLGPENGFEYERTSHWQLKQGTRNRKVIEAPVPKHIARAWKKYHELMATHTNGMVFKDSDGKMKTFTLDLLQIDVIGVDENKENQTYDCNVCYDSFPSSHGVQCTHIDEGTHGETHRTCVECIAGYSKSLCGDGIVAKGGAGVPCSEHGCKGVVLWAHVRPLLDRETRNRLAKRLDHEAVLDVDNMERCKYCNFGMVMEASKEELKVFSCRRCKAEVCRTCQRDFDDLHFGKRCDEMKNVEEMKEERRKQLEEELTAAIIRQCTRCKLPFEKETGCNKMTCRCGYTQCYLCRAGGIDYKHFCNHVRDPDNPTVCPENCDKCLLWENAAERDRRQRINILANQAGDELLQGDDIDRLR